MAEVLSQKQIDELLGSLQSGHVDFKEIEEQTTGPKIKEYDFMSPKKFTREQLKLLDNVFDSVSRMFSLQLAGMLRSACQMEILQVEEEEFREFNNALGDSILVAIIGMNSEENRIDDKPVLVEMSRQISFSIMDRLLGGNGMGYDIERDYTDIELSLLEYVFKQLLPLMDNAWGNYMEIHHSLDMIETNSRLMQLVQPDEAVAIIAIEVTIENLKGNINVCLPASSLEEVFRVFNSKYVKMPKKEDPSVEQQRKSGIMHALKGSPLTISAMLGKTEISLKDLLNLQAGDIIPLNTRVDQDSIVLEVEGLPWFTGVIGTKQKKYAVKINKSLQ
ncbi:MAG: flagellar motor switch protein FliM [Eubacteriales bacterium]|jgi:flagellar motor switch protein FliM